MTDFKQRYKNPCLGFGDAVQNKILRAYNHNKTRKEDRIRTFNKNRELNNISMNPQPDISVITDKRMQKLIKWREERDRRKKLETAKKKPVFKVGVVHHSLCSPIIKNNVPTAVAKLSKAKSPNIVQKRITRATQKRLLAKAAVNNKLAVDNMKNAASTSTNRSINIKKSTPHIKKQQSFAPTNHVFRPPSGLQKMPLFGLVPIEEQTPLEKGDFFIKGKSTECTSLNINNEKILRISLEKLDLPMLDINDAIAPLKTSSPRLSLNESESQKLNKSIYDSDNATALNTTITMRTSLDEQRIQKEDSSQEDRTDMKTPLSQRPTLNNPSSDKEKFKDLIVFSPYLTLSRGKKNARKEQQQRLGIGGSPSDEIPTKDTVMKNLNISVEDEERTAQYFKFLVNKETDRFKELCEKWLDIKLKNEISDDIKSEINQAVGQTNLLISKKFERFRSLVHDCETGRGEMLVTCRDLQGFWDMTYMEVKDCDSRFEKLEQCRDRGWQEEEYTVAKIAIKKPMPAKKRIVSSKPSGLRLFLANKKKIKETGTLNKEDLLQNTSINKEDITSSLNNKKSIIFKENSDTQYNKKSKSINFNEHKLTPAQRESFKTNSVQKLSDVAKRMRSPFAAMKISQMCKTPEIQLDNTISYVNSDQTPAKSILKKSEEIINKETRIKSAHKVNFDDQIALPEVPVDKETQNKLSLAVALNIDSLDLDKINSPKSPVGRRLTFEFDDSDDSKDLGEFASEVKTQLKDKQNKSKSSSVHNTVDFNTHLFSDTTPAGSAKKSDVIVSSDKSLKKQVRRSLRYRNTEPVITSVFPVTSETNIETLTNSETISNAIDLEQNHSEIRILRNRTISINDTPKMNRRSKMMTPERGSVSKKENKSPMKSVERTRRSRKSVAFNEKTCLACEKKPVLPMTPYLKRSSKAYSRRTLNKFTSGEDLISWDTPEHLPSRVTRSNK